METGRGNTKQKIIEESMKLFSVNGFHAVSVRAIADAVGVRNSALYKHFNRFTYIT
ncbi:MAG: helix-turn-helix domain containing protein [Clostridiales bacterium]|nr:helix-turn-helix domain containing protein [Clostridiales bacterium]